MCYGTLTGWKYLFNVFYISVLECKKNFKCESLNCKVPLVGPEMHTFLARAWLYARSTPFARVQFSNDFDETWHILQSHGKPKTGRLYSRDPKLVRLQNLLKSMK